MLLARLVVLALELGVQQWITHGATSASNNTHDSHQACCQQQRHPKHDLKVGNLRLGVVACSIHACCQATV